MTVQQKGPRLELLAAAYFQSSGYLVRRGVPLSVTSSSTDATDVDLVAIKFIQPLREERVIVDCKDRRKARPYERVLWTKGLSAFASADRSVVVTPRAPWQARRFAAEGAVEIIEVSELQRAVEHLPATTVFGEANVGLQESYKKHLSSLGQEAQKTYRLRLAEIRQMVLVGHPITSFNRLVHFLSDYSKVLHRPFCNEWLAKYAAYDAAVTAILCLVRFAAEMKWASEADRRAYLQSRLTYGDLSPNKAKQMAEVLFGVKRYEELASPAYSAEISELMELFIGNPQLAATVPFAVDWFLASNLTEGKSTMPEVGTSALPVSLRLGKKALSAIAYAAELPADVFPGFGDVRPKTEGGQQRLEVMRDQ